MDLRIARVDSASLVSAKYFSAHLPNVKASAASTRFSTLSRDGLSPRSTDRRARVISSRASAKVKDMP